MENAKEQLTANIIQNFNGSVHQLNNNVHTAIYYGAGKTDVVKQDSTPHGGPEGQASSPDSLKEPDEVAGSLPIRDEILEYVRQVRPLVHPDKRKKFMAMWKGILELDAVKPYIYQTGKQKQTRFNRKLIANILRHLDTRHMYKDPYKASDFAVALEGSYAKSVRGELGKFPSDYTCSEINKYLETIGL